MFHLSDEGPATGTGTVRPLLTQMLRQKLNTTAVDDLPPVSSHIESVDQVAPQGEGFPYR
jgi:hypothetical protein